MAGNPNHRVERVSSLLRDVIASLVAQELKDPRVAGATVTDVEVTHDLGEARVFLTGIPAERRPEAHRGLLAAQGYLRREVGRRVQLRVVPRLVFRFDESADHGARIDALLRGVGLSGAGILPGVLADLADDDGESGDDRG